jgi:hypothetical protein
MSNNESEEGTMVSSDEESTEPETQPTQQLTKTQETILKIVQQSQPPKQPTSSSNNPPKQPTSSSNNPPKQPTSSLINLLRQPTSSSNNPPKQPTSSSNNPPKQPTSSSNNPPKQQNQIIPSSAYTNPLPPPVYNKNSLKSKPTTSQLISNKQQSIFFYDEEVEFQPIQQIQKKKGKRGRPPKNKTTTTTSSSTTANQNKKAKVIRDVILEEPKSAQHEEGSIYNQYIKNFPTNPNHVKSYLSDFKYKMLPDYYLEDINSSLKIACSETCDTNIKLNHYRNLVEQYQQKKKQIEEIERQKN